MLVILTLAPPPSPHEMSPSWVFPHSTTELWYYDIQLLSIVFLPSQRDGEGTFDSGSERLSRKKRYLRKIQVIASVRRRREKRGEDGFEAKKKIEKG